MSQITNREFVYCERYFINEEPVESVDTGKSHKRTIRERRFQHAKIDQDAPLEPPAAPYTYSCDTAVVDESPTWLADRYKFNSWTHRRDVVRDASHNKLTIKDRLTWHHAKNSTGSRKIVIDRPSSVADWTLTFEGWELGLKVGRIAGAAVEPAMRALMAYTDTTFRNQLLKHIAELAAADAAAETKAA